MAPISNPCNTLPMGRLTIFFLAGTCVMSACSQPSTQSPATPSTHRLADPLDDKIAQYAPVEVNADLTGLPPNERQALAKLVDAARIIDGLFLDQVWSGNTALLTAL